MASRISVESEVRAARALASAEDMRGAVTALRRSCPTMRRIHDLVGDPPLLRKQPSGFAGMARIIVNQQLSAASADAIWRRTVEVVRPLEPQILAALSDEALRGAGLSRPKIRTLRALSEAVTGGRLDFRRIGRAPESEVRETLTAISGIGPWTADIYLMFALKRPDAFAPGDLALQLAVQKAFALKARPEAEAVEALAERWRPWRAVAARLLWMFYAHERRR